MCIGITGKLKGLTDYLNGKRVQVVRIGSSGGLTVRFLEGCGSYNKGDTVNVYQWEFESDYEDKKTTNP